MAKTQELVILKMMLKFQVADLAAEGQHPLGVKGAWSAVKCKYPCVGKGDWHGSQDQQPFSV